ncbi:acyltransferase family protein [Chitinasiproducens palmae]|uniref:Peptidoglycan/LPS O-acetylase OafA/YrhL, contains acyltransferase and SGNH-hydrolase domains n=1 Tax=Chitinasiproducens palmae TaxID=1770053 RepID=A0A1H2PTK2_9BURK|nr:acyltransferase [Chitinasiproducens palmae]SDV50423.1 Peptidoglycan/LPS O-acetylase OafA/YrhL, contains acyltransferase and SGNH-hydrolase domains [Chitinasiproducens palmae]
MQKIQFEVLNGMRGVAAVLIVVFHVTGISRGFDFNRLFVGHAYLAVDFFFLLSGFVIAYTYDGRWSRMSVVQFFERRLVRLHPLVVLAGLLGLIGYLLDPSAPTAVGWPLAMLIVTFLLGLLLVPSPALPGREDWLFSLNSPLWSLWLEYIGNALYALLLHRWTTRMLAVSALLANLALIWMASTTGKFVGGFGWQTLWVAPFRLLPPFLMGLLVARVWRRLPACRIGFTWLALLLTGVIAAPVLPSIDGISLNGLFDALCIAVLFPLMVFAGIASPSNAATNACCRFVGALSFPLYATHMPFVYVYGAYVRSLGIDGPVLHVLDAAVVAALLLLAWLFHRFWDEPIRMRLSAWTARANRAAHLADSQGDR